MKENKYYISLDDLMYPAESKDKPELLKMYENMCKEWMTTRNGLQSAMKSYDTIKQLFKTYPKEMEFLKIPFSIILNNKEELEDLLEGRD